VTNVIATLLAATDGQCRQNWRGFRNRMVKVRSKAFLSADPLQLSCKRRQVQTPLSPIGSLTARSARAMPGRSGAVCRPTMPQRR
jgi:hypothetical protein